MTGKLLRELEHCISGASGQYLEEVIVRYAFSNRKV